MKKPTCETCDYWNKKDGDAFENEGECRRSAPKGRDYMNRLKYGLTFENGWCGDHQDFKAWQEYRQNKKETK